MRELRGTIRKRLLVNAVVDPDEAAARLPPGLRPHVTDLGTVVGCCLLELERMRPAGVPAAVGATVRAAAHRISVEWVDASGATTVGVYVPVRHTDSRVAVLAGSRVVPGVHRPARITIAEDADRLHWHVGEPTGGFGVRVTASSPAAADEWDAADPAGATCLAALVGLSPDRRGVLEGARMEPAHRRAHAVTIESLDAAFLSGFSTARPARSYLMRDVEVTWTPAPAPP